LTPFFLFVAGPAGLEFFRVVTRVAPFDAGFRHIFLRYQRQRMRLMALCADWNALFGLPIVGHILVGVNLFTAFSREILGPGGKVIERTVTLKADFLVPRWGCRIIRLRLRVRPPGGRQRCRIKAKERKNQEASYS
jgi:hypothetical protein